MAKLIQLHENGVPKYLKTHAEAIDGLASKEEAQNGQAVDRVMTPLATRQAIEKVGTEMAINYDRSWRFIAHRGNHNDYPENSIPAFLNVNSHWGIETDIQVTSDGHWVVMHDATVNRTTNGTGNIKDLTLDQIKGLTLNSKFGGKLPLGYDKVPTLEEYLQCCKDVHKAPVIEIKDNTYTAANYDKLAQILKESGMVQSSVIISFGFDQLVQMRNRLPYIPLYYLTGEITDSYIEQMATLGGPTGINVNYAAGTLTAANVRKCHNAGLVVGVWTVPASARDKMINTGVDFITTDDLGGDLKVGKPTLVNGFIFSEGSALINDSVRELENGLIALNLVVAGGNSIRDVVIGSLPEWAIPAKTIWAPATIRTTDSVSLGTVDISGMSDQNPGKIFVGLGWTGRTNWASVQIVYPRS